MMKSYESYLAFLRAKYGGNTEGSAKRADTCASGKICGDNYREDEIERLINEMEISEGIGG